MIDWLIDYGIPIAITVGMAMMLSSFLALVFGFRNATNKGRRWDE